MAQNFLSDIKLGDNIYIRIGDGTNGDLRLYHNATHSYIDGANTGDLYIRSLSDDVVIQGADDVFIYTQGGEDAIIARGDAGVELFYNTSKKIETTNTGAIITGSLSTSGGGISLDGGNFTMGDTDGSISGKIMLGSSADLEIYHDGTNSYIKDAGTGSLYIQGSNAINLQSATGEWYMDGIADGAVNLYYNNSKKFETTNTGVNVTGTADTDNLTIAGAQGSDGQVLTSTGSGVAWETPSTGSTFTGGTVANATTFSSAVTFNAINTFNTPSGGVAFNIDAYSDNYGAMRFRTNGNANKWDLGIKSDNDFYIYNQATSSQAFELDTANNNATFAGAIIQSMGNPYTKMIDTSAGGDDYGLNNNESKFSIYNWTDGREELYFSGDGNATFAGDVTISGGHLGLSGFPRTDLHATWNQMFIGSKGSLISENGSGGIAGMTVSDNLYIDSDTGTYAYLTTNEASQLTQEAGILTFKNAASGTAGNAPTLTERFKVDASGNATFAGNIAGSGHVTLSGDGKAFRLYPSSYDNWAITTDSHGFVIYNQTDSRYDLKISGTGNATFAGAVAISHGSGDTLTLTKSTTEPSMRFEGDTDKDFCLTISGETFTVTQNDGATDILTLDHDTKAATFAGDIIASGGAVHILSNQITSGWNADSEDSDIWINYRGYAGGTTRYRDFRVGDGKGTQLLLIDGSAGSATFAGNVSAQGGTFTQAGGGVKILNNGTAGYNANLFFGKSNGTDGYSIGQGITANDGVFRIYNNGTASVPLAIADNDNATFTGAATVSDDFTLNNSSPEMYFSTTSASHFNWMIAAQENVDTALEFTPSNAAGVGGTYNTPALTLYANRNATFAGTVNITAGTTGSVGGGHAGIVMTNKFDNPDNSFSIKPQISGVANTGLEIRDETDNASRLVIDGSGNVLIAKTSANSGTVGTQIMSTGDVNATVSGDTVARFNRLSSDGEIIRFQKDTATVGTIGTQNWGIGTGSPNFKLDLVNASASTAVYQQFRNGTTGAASGDGTVMGIDADGDFLINNQEAKTIKLFTSDSERMRITSAGNVGIGTTSPTLSLDVRGTQGSPASSGTAQVGSLSIRGTGSHFISSGMLNVSPWTGWFQAQDANNLATTYPLALNPNGGNVGIGTDSPSRKLQIDGGGTDAAIQFTNTNTGSTASDGTYVGHAGTGTDFQIWNYENGYIRFGTNGAERMVISSAGAATFAGDVTVSGGNLGVGMAASSYAVEVETSGNNGIKVNTGTSGAEELYMGNTGGEASIGTITNHNVRIIQNGAAAISIDTSKNATFAGSITASRNTTTNTVAAAAASFIDHNTGSGARATIAMEANSYQGAKHIEFYNGSTLNGSISSGLNSTGFNTSSDHRLKENVASLSNALIRVDNLLPKTFTWKGDSSGTVVDGFLAHEAQEVVPQAVTGTKDEKDGDGKGLFQSIDQSKLVPLLTAAIKELKARIEILENK